MGSAAVRPIGGLEQCLLDQHAIGGGWISRAVLVDEPFRPDGLDRMVAGLAAEFPMLRMAPDAGWWADRGEAVVAIDDPRSDPCAVMIDHLNRVADPIEPPLHVFTPIAPEAGRCTGVVIGSSHALSDGVTMSALAGRLSHDLTGPSTIGGDRRPWQFAPALEVAIGSRTRRQLATAMFAQFRSGYVVAAVRARGSRRGRGRSGLVTTKLTASVDPADWYRVARDACAARGDRRLLTTVDVRRHRPALHDRAGYLASGFVTRPTSAGRRSSWEDPPTLHRTLSRWTRRTPTPAVDIALSVQHLPPGRVSGSMYGGASVHGFGIPLHAFVHGVGDQAAVTVIFDERRSSRAEALRSLDEIASSLAGIRLRRSESP